MGHVFRHPKYYEELRKKRQEEKVKAASLEPQAPSSKRQATSRKRRAPRHLYLHKVLAASVERRELG